MKKLSSTQIEALKVHVEEKLNLESCDHSLRFAKDWAELNKYDFDDLLDILEANGGFCDCEVILNVPEGVELVITDELQSINDENPWKLPSDYSIKDTNIEYTKILVSKDKCGKNCYVKHDEILIPAPFGAKPKKRTRKSVHFFIGLESGLPNEYGYVQEHL